MLGYISSTRKKSCVACVKAKRRCDLGYPVCSRCASKSLDCSYPNSTVHEAKVVVRQTAPDHVPGTSDTPVVPSDADLPHDFAAYLDSAWLQTWPDSSNPDMIDDIDQNAALEALASIVTAPARGSSSPESSQQHREFPRLSLAVMPQVWEPIVLEQRQVRFIVNKLCTFIPSIAYSGQALFMHEGLWGNLQPEAYQDSCLVSSLYLAKTDKNQSILLNSIDAKIAALLSSSDSWSLEQHLAAVQALIVYQIIRLFDPNLGRQEQAHKQNRLLQTWTAQLWKRSFIDFHTFTDCHDSWIFQESLRRTVMISVFVRGAWSCFVRGGFCDVVPILARLPIMQDGQLWHSTSTEWAAREPCAAGAGKGWITLGDYSSTWSPHASVEELPGLERLLLAACCGNWDPRLLEE